MTVVANGVTTSKTITQATGASGLVSLGTFYFSGAAGESVALTQTGTGTLRASAVQFTQTVAPLAAPVVTLNPLSQTVDAGDYVTFTAAASGNPTPTVQWQISFDGGATYKSVPGANGTTFKSLATDTDARYRAVFTNTQGAATTAAATLTLSYASVPYTTAYKDLNGWTDANGIGYDGSRIRTSTDSAAEARWLFDGLYGTYNIRFYNVVTAGGSTAAKVGVRGYDGSLTTKTISQATGTTGFVDLGNFVIGSSLTPVVTLDQAGSGALYANAIRFVPIKTTAPVVTANPTSKSVAGGTPVNFTAAATGSPTPAVQWQVSADGGTTFTDIAGATLPTYTFTPTAADNGKRYRAAFKTGIIGWQEIPTLTTAATLTVTANPAVTILPGSAGYTETAGTWAASGLAGYNGSATRYSSTAAASAKWTPALGAGKYTVGFYNLVGSGETASAKVSVIANGVTTTRTISQAAGTSGFVTLGTFYFTGAGNESVTLTQTASGILRTSAVQFTPDTTAATAPMITALAASPNPVAVGGTLTLQATGVTDADNDLDHVSFYRESNGTAGYQSGSDTFLGADYNGAWSIAFATTNLAAGDYTFYARAQDKAMLFSNVASIAVHV